MKIIMKYLGLGFLTMVGVTIWFSAFAIPVFNVIWLMINLSAFFGFLIYAIKGMIKGDL